MIDPDGIRRKAVNLYRDFLVSWLNGQADFFPRVIRGRTLPTGDDLVAAIEAVRKLREGSKETRGFGYSIQWREVKSRRFGHNLFPDHILLETQDDFLRLIGKQREFEQFRDAVIELRDDAPALEPWIRAHVRTVITIAPQLRELLEVLRFFQSSPRPDRFARELPLSVDTKFIERNHSLLRQWFDIVLPPGSIRSDEEHFERRYGLRYAEPHLLLRLLDRNLLDELRFPCDELSLPLHTLGKLAVCNVSAMIVENKVNLLTLPMLSRTIALGGLGRGVTLLRYAPWLTDCAITYWGDIDVEGFEILSSLRAIFPQTRSLFMDPTTLAALQHLTTTGSGHTPQRPSCLTDDEQVVFAECRDRNLRLEQERVPHSVVLKAIVPQDH